MTLEELAWEKQRRSGLRKATEMLGTHYLYVMLRDGPVASKAEIQNVHLDEEGDLVFTLE